jgi:putative Ca2+/H+ antiporter (TMEM165/GDT1 family)
MSADKHMMPVWFFIGVLLTVYGAIILTVALVNFHKPSAVVLSQYHPELFGGVFLLLLGGLYTYWFWPGRGNRR